MRHKIWQGTDGRWRTYITQDGERKLVARKNRRDIEKLLNEIYGIDDDITMAELLDEWLEYKALHVEATTVSRIRRSWNQHYAGKDIAHTPIKNITKLQLDTFIHDEIRKQKMTRKQYANFVVILNGLLDYAVDKGIILHNPKKDVKVNRKRLQTDKKKADRTQVFTVDEFSQLRKIALEDYEKRTYWVNQLVPLAVVFMFYSGLRVGEVSVIRYSDIEGNTLNVRRMLRYETNEIVDTTKGAYGDRKVPLITEALELINLARERQAKYKVRTDYIFSMDKKPCPYHAICYAFYSYCDKLGIDRKSTHKARKTFVSTLMDAGVNINTIREIVGHLDERTTLHSYTYDRATDDEKLLKIQNALQNNQKKPPVHSKTEPDTGQ